MAEAIAEFQPEFIVYNAGTDCLFGDPLGRLNVSAHGIKKRDEIIFEWAIEKLKVPIVMLMSGGYQQSNAEVIQESITNIIERFKIDSEGNLPDDFDKIG